MSANGTQPQTLLAAPEQGATPPSLARSPGGREVDNDVGREVNIRQDPPRVTPVSPATPSGGSTRTRARSTKPDRALGAQKTLRQPTPLPSQHE
eukprot:178155-Pyramimonas_sp.AAC.1